MNLAKANDFYQAPIFSQFCQKRGLLWAADAWNKIKEQNGGVPLQNLSITCFH